MRSILAANHRIRIKATKLSDKGCALCLRFLIVISTTLKL